MSDSRRLFLGAGAALGLVACSAGRLAPGSDAPSVRVDDTKTWLAETVTIDMHSHAGRVIVSRDPASVRGGRSRRSGRRCAKAA
jgi:membrane dipeptidase